MTTEVSVREINGRLDSEGRKIRVLIVDDASFMRKAILKMVEGDPLIEVAGTTGNGRPPRFSRTTRSGSC